MASRIFYRADNDNKKEVFYMLVKLISIVALFFNLVAGPEEKITVYEGWEETTITEEILTEDVTTETILIEDYR